jgi:hypothetical protein
MSEEKVQLNVEEQKTYKRAREHDLKAEEFLSDEEVFDTPRLARQNAAYGEDLLTALSPKCCGRLLRTGPNKGKKCQRLPKNYGMCSSHWAMWKRKNPWLISPGHY